MLPDPRSYPSGHPGHAILRGVFVALAATMLALQAHGDTLAQAFEAALQADARLAATHHQIDAAQSALNAAQGLARPQVEVGALYNRFSEEPAFRVHISPLPATALPFAQQEGGAVHAGITLPLYTSGRLGYAAGAAQAQLDAAKTDVERTGQDIKLDVALAYVAVLRAQQMLELANSGVTTLQAHLTDVNAFYERGVVARSDLLAARTAAASAEQERVRSASGLEIAHAAYNRLLGRSLTAPVQLEGLVPVAPLSQPSYTEAAAIPSRAELTGLSRQSEALAQQSAATRAAGMPQVILNSGYTQVQNRYLATPQIWNVAVSLNWTLFDGGVYRSQADALAARAAAILALRADLESQIALQAHAAALSLEESWKRIPVAAAALEEAEENLRVARDRYQSGVGTHTEVLDAETLRIKSASNHFNAIYDNVLAVQRLKRAFGTL